MKRSTFVFLFFSIFAGMASVGFGADDLAITKDKDGTTWSVGSDESRDKRQAGEERDKDRAWDMLQNSSIIFDKRPTTTTK